MSPDDFSVTLVLDNGWGELRIDRRGGWWRVWFTNTDGHTCWLHWEGSDQQLRSIDMDPEKVAVVLLGMAA